MVLKTAKVRKVREMKIELNDEQIKMLFDYDKTKSITIAVNLAKSLVKSYMLEELKEIND